MAKWERLFFQIKRSDGTKQMVSGPSFRGLSLLKMDTGTWSLTHIKSGARIVTLTGDYQSVKRLATDVANLADWNEFATKEDVNAAPGLGERVKAILLSAMGEDEMEAGNA